MSGRGRTSDAQRTAHSGAENAAVATCWHGSPRLEGAALGRCVHPVLRPLTRRITHCVHCPAPVAGLAVAAVTVLLPLLFQRARLRYARLGKVKKGIHKLTGLPVAIKILEKERIADLADVARVKREIHILTRVRHPNVIRLFEVIDSPRHIFLIMEFVPGGELFDYIVAHGRVDEDQACRFFHQILNGTDYFHNKNIIHRVSRLPARSLGRTRIWLVLLGTRSPGWGWGVERALLGWLEGDRAPRPRRQHGAGAELELELVGWLAGWLHDPDSLVCAHCTALRTHTHSH